MKTKEQILEWLGKQPWKGEFYEEVFLTGCKYQISYDEYFIKGAFCWGSTESDINAWGQRHKDFLKWYNDSGRPTTWEEYCRQNPIKKGECYIDTLCLIFNVTPRERDKNDDINVMSKDLCEAFLAYMKLIQLRNAWVTGIEDNRNCKILVVDDEICVPSLPLCSAGLSFPTDKMANEFKDTFRDLLETAKPLL